MCASAFARTPRLHDDEGAGVVPGAGALPARRRAALRPSSSVPFSRRCCSGSPAPRLPPYGASWSASSPACCSCCSGPDPEKAIASETVPDRAASASTIQGRNAELSSSWFRARSWSRPTRPGDHRAGAAANGGRFRRASRACSARWCGTGECSRDSVSPLHRSRLCDPRARWCCRCGASLAGARRAHHLFDRGRRRGRHRFRALLRERSGDGSFRSSLGRAPAMLLIGSGFLFLDLTHDSTGASMWFARRPP